jgi:hypothetical protein
MAVNVCLTLFGSPGQELEEGTDVTAAKLRALAADLNERLLKAAEIVDKLSAAGWSAQAGMYDIIFLNDDIQTRDDARRRLQELGIDPEELMIVEEVEEDEPA